MVDAAVPVRRSHLAFARSVRCSGPTNECRASIPPHPFTDSNLDREPDDRPSRSHSARHVEGGDPRVLRIEKSARWTPLNLKELWAYRELLFFLTWRDVRTSYNQAALGILWAVLKPLLATALFTFVFGTIAQLSGEYKVPYPLFVFTGLLPWTYFASCLALSSDSVVGSASLVTKVYFPRLLIPLAAIVSPIIDFAITFVFLV